MPIIFIGALLLLSSPNIGIFVLVLGVMVWTSRKSRADQRIADLTAARRRNSAKQTEMPQLAGIVAVRRDRIDQAGMR